MTSGSSLKRGPFAPVTRFSLGTRGIIATPASDTARNGWGEPFIDGAGDPIEPGTVNGNNPQSVLKEPKTTEGDWKDKDKPEWLAGNIDWRGPNGEVLSWVGSPTRYFDFVPHYQDLVVGEEWPGRATWQNFSAPDQNIYQVDNLVGYFTVGRVSSGGDSIESAGWIDSGTIYRKGAPWFDAQSNRRIQGAALRTHANGETWLYFVWTTGSGYVNSETLSRVQVPFDFYDPDREDLATVDYAIPGAVSGYAWHHANTSPWFFNESSTAAVAIRKRFLNNNGVYTPLHHRYDLVVNEDGTGAFVDAGVCQNAKASATLTNEESFLGSTGPVPAPRPPPTVGPDSRKEDYTNTQSFSTTYTGETAIAYDYAGDDLVSATITIIGGTYSQNDVWSFSEWYLWETDTLDTVQTTGFVGSYTDSVVQVLSFSSKLPNFTAHRHSNTSSQSGLGLGKRATTYGATLDTVIKYMDLRYGILHIQQYGHNGDVVLATGSDITADAYVREQLWIDGSLVDTPVYEYDATHVYYESTADETDLPYWYSIKLTDTTPPESAAPVTYAVYPQWFAFAPILFSGAVAVSPSGDHAVASFPIWPERDIGEIDRGSWIDNREFYAAAHGLVDRTVTQLKALTESTGNNFRLHLMGAAGK